MYSLYILKDPSNMEIKYVGYSSRIKTRLWEHIRDAKKGVKTHKSNWIRNVLSIGLFPIMEIVKSTDNIDEIKSEEINLIKHLRDTGNNLTNLTNGGDGYTKHVMREDHPIRNWNKGRKMSDESRKKLSESRIGMKFSDEHRRKLSEIKKGKKIPQEAIDRRNQSNSESVKVVDSDKNEYFFDKLKDAVKFTGVNSKQIKNLAYNMKASRKGFMFFL